VVKICEHEEELASYPEVVAEPVFYSPLPVSMFTDAYSSYMENLRPVFPYFYH
jgi:hypothetical protein